MPWRPTKVKELTEDGFIAESGVRYAISDKGTRWRAPSAHLRAVLSKGPVEVSGKDVRTLLLPGVMPDQPDSRVEAAFSGEPAHSSDWTTHRVATGEPTADKKPRPTLDVAIERYGNLDPDIQRFLTRLESWVVGDGWQGSHDDNVGEIRAAWGLLGTKLEAMKVSGVTVKVTPRSRRDAWMRPGAEVALREDVLKRFGTYYPADVLENLTIKAAGDADVFLASVDRDIGPVPKSQVVKREKAQAGKSDFSSAK
jgi:hypothetical protein